jgi:hypothetical protein
MRAKKSVSPKRIKIHVLYGGKEKEHPFILREGSKIKAEYQ